MLNVDKRGAKDVEMDAFGYVMARHGLGLIQDGDKGLQ